MQADHVKNIMVLPQHPPLRLALVVSLVLIALLYLILRVVMKRRIANSRRHETKDSEVRVERLALNRQQGILTFQHTDDATRLAFQVWLQSLHKIGCVVRKRETAPHFRERLRELPNAAQILTDADAELIKNINRSDTGLVTRHRIGSDILQNSPVVLLQGCASGAASLQ